MSVRAVQFFDLPGDPVAVLLFLTPLFLAQLVPALGCAAVSLDLCGPVLHRAHDRGDKPLIRESREAGEAVAFGQQLAPIQLFCRLHDHMHLGQGDRGIQKGLML
ncbi:biotin/lipoyl attachment domain-containing protein (plasmid) [Rhodovulum sulfidophilum]|uniref:Biotin/lipoyl attachment domain-containing protein n=1 Tax=Rhodovulum sulfidophilum TaxID=35806 RepID=A0A0D6B948_RHOSU|nr:biotin/lipoyl attachment domain-containing protein [Rhodovulum sulfidophilum]